MNDTTLHKSKLILYFALFTFRLTVQNQDQAGTVPAKVLDPGTSEIFVMQQTPAEIPCVGVGLPNPQYL